MPDMKTKKFSKALGNNFLSILSCSNPSSLTSCEGVPGVEI